MTELRIVKGVYNLGDVRDMVRVRGRHLERLGHLLGLAAFPRFLCHG